MLSVMICEWIHIIELSLRTDCVVMKQTMFIVIDASTVNMKRLSL